MAREAENKRRRRAFAVMVVLASLFVVVMLGRSLLQSITVHHQQQRWSQDRHQCEWLAESAVQKGIARLQHDREYIGETWKPDFRNARPARAEAVIGVTAVPGQPDQYQISVAAHYWNQAPVAVVQQRNVLLTLKPSGSANQETEPKAGSAKQDSSES